MHPHGSSVLLQRFEVQGPATLAGLGQHIREASDIKGEFVMDRAERFSGARLQPTKCGRTGQCQFAQVHLGESDKLCRAALDSRALIECGARNLAESQPALVGDLFANRSVSKLSVGTESDCPVGI